MNKVAVVVLSEMEEHGDLGRVTNAIQVVKEFKKAGDEVELIFDGGGVVSAVELADPNSERHRLYQQVEDKVSGVCRFCARAFGVLEKAEALNLTMLDEFQQHPSLRNRVENGYQIITF